MFNKYSPLYNYDQFFVLFFNKCIHISLLILFLISGSSSYNNLKYINDKRNVFKFYKFGIAILIHLITAILKSSILLLCEYNSHIYINYSKNSYLFNITYPYNIIIYFITPESLINFLLISLNTISS